MRTVRNVVVLVVAVLVAVLAAQGAHADPGLPSVTRHVPAHPDSLLDGCAPADRALIESRIERAISVGAPQYNDGDFLGCYRTYEATARTLETELPGACFGPIRALREGRQVALAAPTDSAKAWAMRDTFDGLLIVLDRVGIRRRP
jgi:serine protease Do